MTVMGSWLRGHLSEITCHVEALVSYSVDSKPMEIVDSLGWVPKAALIVCAKIPGPTCVLYYQ